MKTICVGCKEEFSFPFYVLWTKCPHCGEFHSKAEILAKRHIVWNISFAICNDVDSQEPIEDGCFFNPRQIPDHIRAGLEATMYALIRQGRYER